jgi:hypothetical protein
MVVAMGTVSMVHMAADHIVEVITVRNAFVPAFWSVCVFGSVRSTLVVGRAFAGVSAAHRNRVFIDVAVMEVMHVTIVKIVRMPLVGYGHVPAIRTMLVTVLGVFFALTFFHSLLLSTGIFTRSCADENKAPIRDSPTRKFAKWITPIYDS